MMRHEAIKLTGQSIHDACEYLMAIGQKLATCHLCCCMLPLPCDSKFAVTLSHFYVCNCLKNKRLRGCDSVIGKIKK